MAQCGNFRISMAIQILREISLAEITPLKLSKITQKIQICESKKYQIFVLTVSEALNYDFFCKFMQLLNIHNVII